MVILNENEVSDMDMIFVKFKDEAVGKEKLFTKYEYVNLLSKEQKEK